VYARQHAFQSVVVPQGHRQIGGYLQVFGFDGENGDCLLLNHGPGGRVPLAGKTEFFYLGRDIGVLGLITGVSSGRFSSVMGCRHRSRKVASIGGISLNADYVCNTAILRLEGCQGDIFQLFALHTTPYYENFTLAMTNFKSFVIFLPMEDSKNALSDMWFQNYR
jgi:hypothetical protein